ncbi:MULTISPECIES: DUF3742 family protein [Pseudomonadaceae]|jgi:hypothetical protein|uniref:DUF3742 domain-containing protein n=5 Tax=Pseudomonadaceae TaxID=135621 RepID=A0A2T5PNW7_ECTOL|nr:MULTISPECIES: DUF3742 family protein [Pseudomonadaceae]EZQ19327.1 hypothetical protein CF98_02340 [Halopseudomonas bauzanensis]MBX5568901.1 DUF3742 family protein [Pseudomonas aeruginosa]TDL96031.1 DUF3742 family protein [Stutzerimonas stutzeri ATCC 17588 = LMG 11199]AFM32530.1 hypothetical protein A458_06420 [Stutzerimonas stutzeri CCUG 29243]ANI13660.1 hypothetical protein A9C11_06530 [Pseudomonas citronellolis]
MSMTTNTHNGRWSHRLGRGAGRAWRGYQRREQRVAGRLVTRGVPAGAATAVLWIVKLAVLGMLLYTVSWLVLLLAFAVVATWFARNADADDEKQPELRDGHSGVGLYDKDDWRIDMGDPDEP